MIFQWLVLLLLSLQLVDAFVPKTLPVGATLSAGKAWSKADSDSDDEPDFPLLEEREAYSGWRTVVQRDVRMPSGETTTFDVIDQEHESVVVFVWDSETRTTTLIREYAPGQKKVSLGIVAGMYEEGKHASPLEAARFELEEEAHLTGGRWLPLLADMESTIAMDKYNANTFHCFLVVDPLLVTESPRPLDPGEWIDIKRGLTLTQVRQAIAEGELSLVSASVCLLAMQRLRELYGANGDE